MKKKIAYIVIGFALIIVVSQLYLFVNYKTPKVTIETEYDFYALQNKNIGFDLDKDKLHFGLICKGCTAHRDFSIKNDKSYPLETHFVIESEDESPTFFSIDPPPLTKILPGEKKDFTFYIKVPENYDLKGKEDVKLEGKIQVQMYKLFPFKN